MLLQSPPPDLTIHQAFDFASHLDRQALSCHVPGETVCHGPNKTMCHGLVAEILDSVAGMAEVRPVVFNRKQALARLGGLEDLLIEVMQVMQTESPKVHAQLVMAFARGEAAPLPSFDQAAWCPYGQFNERSFDSLLDEWRTVRAHTISLVAGLPVDALPRRGVASGNALSVRAALAIATGHVAYHLKHLREHYV